ncbi:MAG: hypothetical protein Q4F57_07785 [Weeksellaceae bacterium]|nr:hypothetical protein [Weeksellaceae bacterium]
MKDNLEKDFHEKLREFEITPPNAAWENISKEINKNAAGSSKLWKILAASGMIVLPVAFAGLLWMQSENISLQSEENATGIENVANTTSNHTNTANTTSPTQITQSTHTQSSTHQSQNSYPTQNSELHKQSIVDVHQSDSHTNIASNDGQILEKNQSYNVVSAEKKPVKPKAIQTNSGILNEIETTQESNKFAQKEVLPTHSLTESSKATELRNQNENSIIAAQSEYPTISVNSQSEIKKPEANAKDLTSTKMIEQITNQNNIEIAQNAQNQSLTQTVDKVDGDSQKTASISKLNKEKNVRIPQLAANQTKTTSLPVALEVPKNDTILHDQPILSSKKIPSEPSKFSVEPYAGLGRLASFNGVSLIAGDFNQLDIENQTIQNIGARVGYRINEKLLLRTGLGMVNITQNTYAVPMTVGGMTNSRYNIKSDLPMQIYLSNPQREGAGIASENINPIYMDMRHDIRYIDIPLEAEYEIARMGGLKFLGIGGLGTLILDTNDIYMTDALVSQKYGAATTLKTVSFSANLGLKSELQISRMFTWHIEPQFRYMINTVTANPQAQPYMFGANTGFRISF